MGSQGYLDAIPGQAIAGGALVGHGPGRGRPLIGRHRVLHGLGVSPACRMTSENQCRRQQAGLGH